MKKVFLSPPDVGELEIEFASDAIRSGWVAPLGPYVDKFEADISAFTGAKYAVALSSGSAALQLGIQAIGVSSGDEVIMPTLTFAATPFSVIHAGGKPVFLDSEIQSWNLDPNLLSEFLAERNKVNQLPKLVLAVDLFGQTANYAEISEICAEYGVALAVDSAESLGSLHEGKPSGRQGTFGAFSFNGNKIMTTSGGGMLVTDDENLASRVRFLSTQARLPYPWYEHEDVGYNFRMSNVLAAIGCAQLIRLDDMIARRHNIRNHYIDFLEREEVQIVRDAPWTKSNSWLSIARFESSMMAEKVRGSCSEANVEVRPVWKPMHLQPVFKSAEFYGGNQAEKFFNDSLCLPSGSKLTDDEIQFTVEIISHSINQ
jgi:dTDP-4-amino-4,6-dideoxygalactose transaminase